MSLSPYQDYKAQEEAETGTAWMLTFADLLSLILAFFVLLFATTSVKKPEWEKVAQSLSQRLNPNKDARTSEPAAEISIETEEHAPAKDLGYLNSVFLGKITQSSLAAHVMLQERGDRLVISIAGDNSFLRGSTQMTPRLQEILNLLSQMLRSTGNRIEIHGNADASPTQTVQYPSNWELSLARALEVGKRLRADGYPYRLSIYGRGDSTYNTLPESLSAQERDRLSRRIDIIIRAERAEYPPQ